jgi:hypothetical protein
MTTSDLATETRVLFQRVAEAAKSSGASPTTPQTPVNVLNIWRSVFGCDAGSDARLLRSLAVIASRLERLDNQISASIIDGHQKRIAHEAVLGLIGWTKPDIFQRNASDFLPQIHPDKLALVGFLSLALKHPTATLLEDELKEIAEQIDELGRLVLDANIEPDLKKLLIGHLAYMAWAIRNIDIVGAEGVYDAFGPALLTAKEAAGATELSEGDPQTPSGKSIFQRLFEIVRKTLGFLEGADKTVRLIEHLGDDIDGLLP